MSLFEGYTLVDKYCCWELWSLIAQTCRLSGDCIEIGVWRGGTGCLIAQRVKNLGLNCDVFLCDTFCGVVKAGMMDDAYAGGEHADTGEESVRALANRLGVGVKLLKGIFPEETASQVEAKKFRFCHIDVDVYRSARDSTEWIWPRLVSGGIVVFDDYGFQGCDGVRKFVEEWTANSACTLLHNLNGHAILVKP
jgi:O-methyltransferase